MASRKPPLWRVHFYEKIIWFSSPCQKTSTRTFWKRSEDSLQTPPLLLPSTKFSPSHLYKHCAVRLVCDLLAELRITKFHVLRDIFAKHLSALNPRHTSATYMNRSNSEAALVSRGMDALAVLLSYHVQREANLLRSVKDNFAFSTEDIHTAVAVLREKT
jgi:hypothetical protein